jgi:hypothetical protein
MNFLMKKMLKKQLKSVPEDQQEMIMTMVEKDPKFFGEIAKEIKEAMNGGLDQQQAAMQVMVKHKNKIQQLMGK